MSEMITHDAMVLAYLMRFAQSEPLLAAQIERAKVCVERDLLQAQLQARPLQAVEPPEDRYMEGYNEGYEKGTEAAEDKASDG